MRKYYLPTILFLLSLVLMMPAMVLAVEDVVLNAAIYVNLTSPSTTLVIATGATMDELVVDTDNIVVSMSAGNFPVTITSSDRYQFTVSGITDPGTTCGADESTIILPAQGGAVDVTLTLSTVCAVTTGGSGGGTYYDPPAPEEGVEEEDEEVEEVTEEEEEVVTTPISEMTITQLKAEITRIAGLIAELQVLLLEMIGEVEGCTITSFDRNLQLAMSGDDVKCLQVVLNSSADTQVAPSGVGSSGNETNYFGSLTKAAVIKFQEKYADEVLAPWGLSSGNGFVGSKTREKLNELF